MFHMVLGWQQNERLRLAAELGLSNPNDQRVKMIFYEQYNELAQKPNKKNIVSLYQALREQIVVNSGQVQWVACLALIRSWRDDVDNLMLIERALEKIRTVGDTDFESPLSVSEMSEMVCD